MKRVIYLLSVGALMAGLGVWSVGCAEQSRCCGHKTKTCCCAKSEAKTCHKERACHKEKKCSMKKSCDTCPASKECPKK